MEMSGQLHYLAALLQGKEPWYTQTVGWVGPRTSANTVAKRKKSLSTLEIKSWSSNLQPSPYTD